MKCFSDGALLNFLDAELDELGEQVVRLHLVMCEKCQKRVKRFREIDNAIISTINKERLFAEAERASLEQTADKPTIEQINQWLKSDTCLATDGCVVKHDGMCPHGYPSWLKYLGLI